MYRQYATLETVWVQFEITISLLLESCWYNVWWQYLFIFQEKKRKRGRQFINRFFFYQRLNKVSFVTYDLTWCLILKWSNLMSASLSSHFIILLTYPLDTLDIQLESLSESFLCPLVVKTRYCWGSLECPLPILRWLRSLAGDVTQYPLDYFCSVFCYNKLMLLLHFWLMLNVFLIDTLFTQTKYFTCMFVRSCY